MNLKSFDTELVCSSKITFSIENGILSSVKFYSGCSGSLQGIGKLVEGMSVDDVIRRLKGIKCGNKATSCPDQLARALEKASNCDACSGTEKAG